MEGDILGSDPTSLVLGVITALITILGAAFTAYRWAQKAIEKAREDAAEDADKVRKSVAIKNEERQQEIAILRQELQDFKLQATREFATLEHVQGAISSVHNSVEKVINRIDAFAVEFNRALLKLAERP